MSHKIKRFCRAQLLNLHSPTQGVSPTRPSILFSIPPVEVAEATFPWRSTATAPTVPIFPLWKNMVGLIAFKFTTHKVVIGKSSANNASHGKSYIYVINISILLQSWEKKSDFSHLALDWVGLGCQVLPPAHAGVVSDEGLLLDQRDTHGLRKLLGAPCCQAHVTRLELRSKFLSEKLF